MIGLLTAASVLFALPSRAATVTSATDYPQTFVQSADANHRFTFVTPSGAAEGTTITLTFASSFDTSAITEDDVDVVDNGVSLTTAVSCGSVQASVAMASDILTIGICGGGGGAILAGHTVTVRIGLIAVDSGTGTHRIVNPAGIGTYYVSIGGTFGDFGSIAYPIYDAGSGESVGVSATVTNPAVCGNAVCEAGETHANCAVDCPSGGGCSGGSCPPPPDTTAPAISGIVVSNLTKSDATISWNTNESASGYVEYGLTTDYGASSPLQSSFLSQQSVSISGLTEGATYHFKVHATDIAGNPGASDDQTFTTLDQTAPVISNVTVSNITKTGATVSWATNEPSTGFVEYGATAEYGSVLSDNVSGTTHSITLSGTGSGHVITLAGLTPGTTYHFRVHATDASLNESITPDQSFDTTGNAAPSNVSPLNATPGNHQNVLTWTNPSDPDLASVRVVACTQAYPTSATDTGHGCSVVSNALITTFTHTGLTNGATYYYGVFTVSNAGLYSTGTLVTAVPVAPDVPPGDVSGLAAAPSNQRVRLTWTNPTDADLAAIRVVACPGGYPSAPTDTSNGCVIGFDTLGTTYTQTGLTNEAMYYYGVYARDAAGQYSTGMRVSAVPTAVDAPPAPVSGLLATSGDGQVRVRWTNPTDEDLAAIRVLVCAAGYPISPISVSGCTVLLDAIGTTVNHTGLTNGTTYYYGVYARDAAGQYSTGTFVSGLPSAAVPVCGDGTCNGTETPLTCAIDCGAVQPVCGNQVCETGETTQTCPADCGLLPACGNGVCDVGEVSDTCPADCPVTPPTNVPNDRLLAPKDVSALVGPLRLSPVQDTFTFLPARQATFQVDVTALPVLPERVQLAVGTQLYNLTLQTSADGRKYFETNAPIPALSGSFATAVSVFYADGKSQTIPLVSRVQDQGLVYEHTDAGDVPVAQAVVTLLAGKSGNAAWDASASGQGNPHITGNSGTFGWYAPNGSYRVRVEKGGYQTTTATLDVANNIAATRVRLRPEQPLIPTVIQTVQDIQQNPVVQQAADTTAPAVIAVVAANTAGLAVGFNLLAYLRYITTAPVLFFSRRKRKGYGVVYNAITKLPVDLAIVRLYRVDPANPAAVGQLVASRVTDKGGRYFFLAQPGSYRLTATKPGFTYPSTYLQNAKDDGTFLDVYHNEPIKVEGTSAAIAANIPLDPSGKAETPARIVWMRRLRVAQSAIAIIGNIGAVGVLVIRPSAFTAVMAAAQLGVYALVRRLASPNRPVNWGIVYDKRNGRPLSNVIARVFEPKYNKLLETAVTDSRGRFTFLLGPNEYYAVFERDGFAPFTLRPIDYSKRNEPSELATRIALEPGSAAPAPTPAVPPAPPTLPTTPT